jgi:hypothetical protein
MSRIKGRLNRLERHAGPAGACPACRGKPVGGVVVMMQDLEGREVSRSAPGRCKACGDYGPSTWVTVDPRPAPQPRP